MPTANWLGTPSPIDPATRSTERAYATARHIAEKPTSVTFQRHGTFIAAQTCRIEGQGGTSRLGSVVVQPQTTFERGITLFGVRGHADAETYPDFDVQPGDRFGLNGSIYTVTGVTLHAGEVQAAAVRVQS